MSGEPDHVLLRKVRLLRVMAERSTNEHEAHTAALLAQKLMAEHGLSEIAGIEIEEEGANPVVNVPVTSPRRRMPVWQSRLLNVVAGEFRCKAYFHTDPTDPASGRSLRLVGRSRDCGIVVEVWAQAVSAASRLSARYTRNAPLSYYRTLSPRTSWCEGFVTGLGDRLAEQRRGHQEWGLVLVPDEQVRAEVAELHLKAAHSRRVFVDTAARLAGWQAGHAHDARRPDRVDATRAPAAALPHPK